MKETRHEWKLVEIEEFYEQDDDGNVYRNWRVAGSNLWTREFTPYKDMPWYTPNP